MITMEIKQWEDKNLAQFSYGILSNCEKKIVLIDPMRDPSPYLDWAAEKNASIAGIIETHPHADFVSGHLELRQRTGAIIYVHSLVGAAYDHQPFDDGMVISLGKIRLISLHTPGHSPDSISILLEYEGRQHAVFTGDTLFVGDCGRPDLREGAGNIQARKEALAREMYQSLRTHIVNLNDEVIVYPGHGAGSLCGKNLGNEGSSTVGREKQTNWSLQETGEEQFVIDLLTDQPFIPAYFSYDVELNRKGAPALRESIAAVRVRDGNDQELTAALDPQLWIIDAREEKVFKKGHLPHSINIMETGRFETWLGSIIMPGEQFYITSENKGQLERLLERAAAIGYETQIKEAFVTGVGPITENTLDIEEFRRNEYSYTIVDVRDPAEVQRHKPFKNSIAIPLAGIRSRVGEIPTGKAIVVHCAGGYRSAAASSIIRSSLNGAVPVYDLGEAIRQFI